MKVLKTLHRYIFSCGIENAEYNALKKDAYISNFGVWRVLHVFMTLVFGILFVSTLANDMLTVNRPFYLAAFIYSAVATFLFFVLRSDSLVAQLLIYLSMSVLFLFGAFITQNKPDIPATTFMVFLLVAPLFMIDRPIFMAIELCAASAVFLTWMYSVKPYDIWQYDKINVIVYTVTGIFLNVVANSIRIKEFVLTKKINIQKDTDELTGLKSKAALTREINEFLADGSKDKGILFLLDIDRFKAINDTYGHDVGDLVIRQMGDLLGSRVSGTEIAGRFGGDEFLVFVKDTDDPDTARSIARDIIAGAAESVSLPDKDKKISVSIGIALYDGLENNYSEIFKKADMAMYKAKSDPENRFCIYE